MANKAVNASLLTLVILSFVPNVALAMADIEDDLFIGPEDTTILGNVLLNDTPNGPVGNTLSVINFTGPGSGTFNIDPTGILTYTPDANFSGVVNFTYDARESRPICTLPLPPSNCTHTGTGEIFVSPVADVPIVSTGAPSGPEDTAIPLGMGITEVDADGSETPFVRVAGIPVGGTLSVGISQPGNEYLVSPAQVGSAALTPPENFNGTITLSITSETTDSATNEIGTVVSDFGNAGSSFPVVVTAANDNPVADGVVPSISTVEDVGASVNLAGAVSDVDIATNGDVLSYLVTSIDNSAVDTAVVAPGSSILTITLRANQFALGGSVAVQVNDSFGGAPVSITVPVDVAPANDSPFATGLVPALVTDEDVSASVDLAGIVDDVDILTDGDSLSYAVLSTNNSAIVDPATIAGTTLTISVIPDQNELGGSVTVRVTDDDGSAPVDVVIPVDVRPVNDDPELGVVPSITTDEDVGASVDLLGSVTDVDIATNGDALSYLVTSVDNTAIDGTPTIVGSVLSIAVLPNAFASGTVTVQVSDNSGGAPVDVVVPVDIVAVNDLPTLVGAVPNVSVLEDAVPEVISLAGLFADDDIATGDSLSYSATRINGDDIFDAIGVAGETLTLTFTAEANGAADIEIEATDSAGAAVSYILGVAVQPVNDEPFVSGSIGPVNLTEDVVPAPISIAGVFDDVDIITNADVLTYEVTVNTNPALFTAVNIVGDTLVLGLVEHANGVSDFEIIARDLAGAASDPVPFTVTVDGDNDSPNAADDVLAAILEDSAEFRIDVLANDFSPDLPTTITQITNISSLVVVDVNGDPLPIAAGTVLIDGDEVVFTPTANFTGVAMFEYTIRDGDGEEDSATVTFNIDPVNDPPEGRQSHSYSIFEGNTLTVDAVTGLLSGAYDVDPSLVDEFGTPIAAQPLSVVFETVPPATEGTLTTTASDGTFTFVPLTGFVGVTTFTYTVFDNSLKSEVGTVSIEVLPLPPVAGAPNPGEVSVLFNLANTPLEQSAAVPPNVLVSMDDSGSMDWQVTVDSLDDNGRFVISNSGLSTGNRVQENYSYLFDLPTNSYGTTSGNGQVLPSEESLAASAVHSGNDYRVWRARSAAFNGIYYNPEVTYRPWTGRDNGNLDFADAVPTAIRLDPLSTANTFDILALKSYTANDVPRWIVNGGTADITVTNYYIPRYYTPTGTLVAIVAGNAPFNGGDERDDCAANDGTCTYAEEIQNFANWFQYYRSRELVAKAALGNVVAELQDIRVGYETINRVANEPIAEMNEYYWEGEKRELLDTIYGIDSINSTPLRRALDDAGRILGCDMTGRACPSLPAPEGICQQNYNLLFSDGYWNGTNPRPGNFDADGPGAFDGGKYAGAEADTLADIAMYYYENDLFPTVDDGVPLATADIDGAPADTFADENDLIHQHMKTFTIAFGVEPDIVPATAEQADVGTAFPWPATNLASNSKIDDMLHAAINGRGRFLNAADPQDLQNSVGTAFLEFTQAASSTSAAAFNSTSLRDGTLLYRGFYDLRNRTGELTATAVSTTGVISATPTWTAAELLDATHPSGLLPSERVIVTFDPSANAGTPFLYNDLTVDQQATLSENQVNFIRGSRTFEQPGGSLRARLDEEGLLGDIVNSSPIFVGAPRGFNRDQSPYPTTALYSEFVAAVRDRQRIVYVGANDGLLHGFDAITGEEVMGYIPNMILDASQPYSNKLNALTSTFYLHNYYVDLAPQFNDAFMRPSSSGTKQWITTLVGGLGAGGKGYFALNVTDPATLFADQTSAKNAVLWEFTDQDDTYPEDTSGAPIGGVVNSIVDPNGDPVKDLGHALSLPIITMSNVVAGDGENEWAAVFGNGSNSTSGIATLFVLFLDKGLDGWAPGDFAKVSTGFGVPLPGEQLEGFPNALGSPTAIDRDLNGTVDLVYAGDRLGNLFRFELDDANPDNWVAVRLFTANYDDSGTNVIQPILSKPLVVKHPEQAGFLVSFGTGSFVAEEDGSNTDVQSIYTIWDPLVSSPPTANADTKVLRLVEQTMTNVVDDSVTPAQTRRILTDNAVTYAPESGSPGVYGWYVDLDLVRAEFTLGGDPNSDTSGLAPPSPQFPGERAIRRFIVRNGVILTTTVLPATNAISCFGARPGALLLFDGLTGGNPDRPVIDFNRDGVIDNNDFLSTGGEDYAAGYLFDQSQLDGALVDLSTLSGEGDTDYLFVSGGNDTDILGIEPPRGVKTGRLSWSELQIE